MAALTESVNYHSDSVTDEIENDLQVSGMSIKQALEIRFGELEIFKNPLQLIYTDSCGQLAVNKSVLSDIKQIDVPLNVIAVCGLYRTGKSYLMNRLAGKNGGFPLGSTTRSHTKGVWALCVVHPKKSNQVLLLLDTEGLADIKKEDSATDNHIFSLTILLSNTLIYNMMGVFNKEALEKLAKLSENIKVLNSPTEIDANARLIRAITPYFILCLRDFFLDIEVGTDGNEDPSPDEYFEDCLNFETSRNDVSSYNKTRECIVEYFLNRKCFTIPQPTLNRQLRHLETLRDEDLDPEFVAEINAMRDFIYELDNKYLDAITNVEVNGPVFALLVTEYVFTIRKGSTLTYQDAFTQVAQYHNKNLVEATVKEFSDEMDTMEFPFKKKEDLVQKYGDLRQKYASKFREKAYPYSHEEFENELLKRMQVKFTAVQQRNSDAVQQLCQDMLQYLYRDIEKNLESFNDKDGFEMYKIAFGKLEDQYNFTFGEYDNDERMRVLKEFKRNKNDDKMMIYRVATDMQYQIRFEKAKKEIEDKIMEGLQDNLKKLLEEREAHEKERMKVIEELLASIMTKDDTNIEENQQTSEKSMCPIL